VSLLNYYGIFHNTLCQRGKYNKYVELNDCNTIMYSLKITVPGGQAPMLQSNQLHAP
jgi:hypothetical protein